MEKYLNTPIKEVISTFPEVGTILETHGIGCVPCSVGSCLMRDIIHIHNLSEDEESELMAKIATVIYPGKSIVMPKLAGKADSKPKTVKQSPPIRMLVDEHALIKRWIALIPRILDRLDVDSPEDRQLLAGGIDFIRSYADKFHHAKEEAILFKYCDESLDIIKAMLQDHTSGRGHAAALAEALEKRDRESIAEHLKAYGELLTEHIRKEDQILYPWIDRNLSVSDVGDLFAKFNAVNEIISDIPERSRVFVTKLEEQFRTL